uniref:Dispatched RND transporter family member 3 n=1 Tax=Gadus morhua TaxID=8049 RepID=A0A8C5F559_GADMO
MDLEDDPLLFQTSWRVREEDDEEEPERGEEEPAVHTALGGPGCSGGPRGCGVWSVVGCVYTRPWASGLVLGLGFLLPCALSAYMFLYCPPLDIDLSYGAFEVHSHFSAQRFDALTAAVKTQLGSWDRERRGGPAQGEGNLTGREAADHDGTPADGGGVSPSRRRRLAPGYSYLQSQALWRVELVFVAQGSGQRNIFTPGRLATVHRVERLLMTHPRFTAFCWKPLEALRDLPLGPSYCSPPSSLLSYLFPSERAGKIFYDGMGPDLADIQGALRLAITHPQFYWYVDDSLSPERLSSSLLRSEVHFGAPLPSFSSTQDRPEEQRRRFKEFVVQYASMLAEQSTSEVKVLFGGTELFDDEVRTTFHNDMRLALISGVCIAALVFVLTSFSVFLTFFGLISIGLSCLVALFLYHVVFGVRYLGILNGVAAFVIIGIGVDDVFVFISTFRQASHLEDRVERAVYTVKTAGRATFLTSFTTAAAYAANTFSQIPAVHDFGLFMALIVSCCWLWVSILVPAALCIWSQRVAVREEAWLRWWKSLASLSASHSPLSDEDDDVALLSVEMEPGDIHEAPVDRLLQLAPLRLLKPPGAYFLVLLLSAGCCCLMRPATHAPLLFRPDTNLQTLLALRSNLSGQGISCPTCSGEPPEHTHNTLEVRASTPLYRFSLNASTPAPWTAPRPDNGEVSSFQVRGFSSRMTVCVSRVYQPHTSWMLTAGACEPRHGWTPEFSFFASLARQEHSRRLFFAQHRLRPHCSRVCSDPPGCGISSVPEGPTQGTFYSPLPSGKSGPAAPLSKTLGFNPCSGGVCGPPAVRPLVDTGAMVFVVFGILGVNRTQRTDNHVIGDTGRVILDPDFDIFQEMEHLCKICKAISANKQLVKPGGAQCLPSGNKLSSILPLLHPECQALPEPNLLPGQLSHGAVGMRRGKVLWLSMAFESTTYKGKSSFQTHADFLQWETFVRDLLATLPPSSALRRGFQTCEHWKQIFMEIIGVESALWSLLLSLAICVAAVSVFTAHLLLLLPILLTILGVVCVVVAIMYWLGWELGAVEAISLSILVGSSVDYCLHLVEGFLLAGESMASWPDNSLRQRRALEAVNHVGVAIVSSAVTTVISTVPLFFCVIVPFAKFGQIVAINTAVSIAFTLTVTVALLACVGPAGFSRPRGAVLKASLAVSTAVALGAGLCWAGGRLGSLAWPPVTL